MLFALIVLVFSALLTEPGRAETNYAGVPSSGEILFEVFMEGDKVGQDRITFDYTGDTLVVERSVTLSVSYVYISFLDYNHESTGFWQNGELQRLEASTTRNGETKRVRAKRIGDEVAILTGDSTGRSGGRILPTSWWHPGITENPTLLDTQFGQFRTIRARKVGQEQRRIGDRTVVADRYRIEGDLELQLWYGPERELAGIQFERKGYTFTYERIK